MHDGTGDRLPAGFYATTMDLVPAAPPGGDRHDSSAGGQGLQDTHRPIPPFDDDEWVTQSNPAPQAGWRRTLWRLTGGRFRPALTDGEQRIRSLLDEARRPFPGARTIAVISTKGGVGKTTTTLNLGHTLSSIRGDRVIALDANPDAGSLGYRVERETRATAADLLALDQPIRAYAQIRPFTSQASSRLEIIASPDDPRLTQRMERDDYERLLAMLQLQYNLILADCGTGILDSATQGVVQSADQLVVVTGPSVDAARAVTYLLSWLCEHGLADKVNRAIVVINGVRSGRRPVDVERISQHFQALTRAAVVIPWDQELANGATVELEWLAPPTRQAYLQLAALLIDAFVTTDHADPTTQRNADERLSTLRGTN